MINLSPSHLLGVCVEFNSFLVVDTESIVSYINCDYRFEHPEWNLSQNRDSEAAQSDRRENYYYYYFSL
jgi:hypothetical protein